MAKSKNNALYIGIAVAVVVVIAIVVGIILGTKGSNNGAESGEPGTSQGTGTTADYSRIDEVVEYGDYEAMEDLSKRILNGEATGEVVQIKGYVAHPMSTYSVMQKNASGSMSIGTQFIIKGADDADYPEDGETIVITGEVIEQSPLYFVIQTTPEYIQTIEVVE